MNINQLKDDLSEMSSRLTLKEKELLKQKEDNRLLLKRLKSRQERSVDTVTEVCMLYIATTIGFYAYTFHCNYRVG